MLYILCCTDQVKDLEISKVDKLKDLHIHIEYSIINLSTLLAPLSYSIIDNFCFLVTRFRP